MTQGTAFAPIPVVEVDRAAPSPWSGVRLNSQGRVHIRLLDRGWPIADTTLEGLDGMTREDLERLLDRWVESLPEVVPSHWPDRVDDDTPAASVVVCTLGRTDELLVTLSALRRQDHPDFEIVVVDNEPATGRVARMVAELIEDEGADPDRPAPVCVAEPRPGLSRARNAGVHAARHELIAFTDDDAIPGPGWLRSIVEPFAADPGVGCVTGPVLPSALDTEPQWWFEQAAGFGKGFAAMYWGSHPPGPRLASWVRPGHRGVAFPFTGTDFGSGNNMAFRRSVLDGVGPFDAALGAGSLTMGGEDLDMFRRVFTAGHGIVYHPAALVTHTHRETVPALRRQMYGYGLGMAAVMLKQVLSRDALRLLRLAPASVRYLLGSGSAKNADKRPDFPPELTRVELRGYLAAPWIYLRSRMATRGDRKAD